MAQHRTTTRMSGQVYIANESFVGDATNSGVDKSYMQGLTRVYEGSPEIEKWPHLFDLLEDRQAVERG